MTEEEIKKLSAEYAEAVCPIEDYDELDDPLRETDIQICEYDAKSVLEWLSRDYCIVPKSAIDKLSIAYRAKAYNLVCLNKEDVENLFGKEMFEEDKK